VITERKTQRTGNRTTYKALSRSVVNLLSNAGQDDYDGEGLSRALMLAQTQREEEGDDETFYPASY
jgi:hypothetical protein